ncbi:NAD(P)-dependent dehydrogenase, short-chain alcohol dehydrogenase family [Geosmithia morbida]|uniref:NAD(P)-dependent dehydrogenase, short-chain alcohol dehydrogenase family n=1 Tax=Geosmithia morbida TaxID=1094350 RepID=A0A9P4YZM8_9HYPO|nr:NAD(P)-dependent dehydrogenase, short-chain alcohol dehydrogenase family [Geosmithia morbida]KAF4124717.1 NAD(P)-dependent dehydrogenase, short-chain alcohol dehydrogenase family [Geosmithia morbida]
MELGLCSPSREDAYDFVDACGELRGGVAGETIRVTGAGTGIGRAVASIASLAPGCKVIVKGGTDVYIASVNDLFASLPSAPDVLVHHAAAPVADSYLSAQATEMDINIHGMCNVTCTYISVLKQQSKTNGCIINVSPNASWRHIPGLSCCSMTKADMNVYRTRIRKMMNVSPDLPLATAGYLSTDRADFLMGRFVIATWDMQELEGLKAQFGKKELLRMMAGVEWRG